MVKATGTLLGILLNGKTPLRFVTGVIISFGFSMAVILSTIGLMDGYDETLKNGLRSLSGDLLLSSREGFFSLKSLEKKLREFGITTYAPITQVEAFAIHDGHSLGVSIRAVDRRSFYQVTGLALKQGQIDTLAIGKELAKKFKIKVGDEITLGFSSGNSAAPGLPLLKRFKIGQIVSHKVYEKDLRVIYASQNSVNQLLDLGEESNLVLLSLPPSLGQGNSPSSDIYMQKVASFKEEMNDRLPYPYVVRTFWQEYGPLIEAVKVEKFSITVVLQLVVVIAIFNVFAFLLFLKEKKSQEIFLLEVLGSSKAMLVRILLLIVFFIWFASIILAYFLTEFFDYLLQNWSYLQLPGDIYNLSSLSLGLELNDYLFVYFGGLFWVALMAGVGLRKFKRQAPLQGLRQEFS